MHRPPTKQAQKETIFQVKTTQSQAVYKCTAFYWYDKLLMQVLPEIVRAC